MNVKIAESWQKIYQCQTSNTNFIWFFIYTLKVIATKTIALLHYSYCVCCIKCYQNPKTNSNIKTKNSNKISRKAAAIVFMTCQYLQAFIAMEFFDLVDGNSSRPKHLPRERKASRDSPRYLGLIDWDFENIL